MKKCFFVIIFLFLSFCITSSGAKRIYPSLNWYIEKSDIIVYGRPVSITDSCGDYNIVFENLLSLKSEIKDTFMVRIEYKYSTAPLCYVDDIRKNYLLFLSNNDTSDYYNITTSNLFLKIERYYIWDFDSTYLKKNNLDSIFTYGFNTYRTTDKTFLIDTLKLDFISAENATRHCHYVEGIDCYACGHFDGAGYNFFPDSLLINVFNSGIYRKELHQFQIIPDAWLCN